MMSQWSRKTSDGEVARRAGGRARYNALRRDLARIRRKEVERLLLTWGHDHGVQARIAAHLGVSPATISRDLTAILPLYRPCPTCDLMVAKERWEMLEQRRTREAMREYSAGA